MNYILKIRIKHCTKEVLRIAKIVLIALILLIGLILIKYKPLYKVEINNKEIGYVKNKIQFNNLIKENIEKTDNTKIAFITLSDEPEYEFKLVTNRQQTNEEEIITSLKENSIVTYTAYGITLNEDIKAYVENEQEAQDTVNLLKEQYSKDENYINIGIRQIYTQEDIQTVNLENAVKTLTPIAEKEIDIKVKEKEKENAIAVVNSVVIAAKPVSGSITSRFSENSRIRSSAHTGLDIATKTGTPIKVCSSGKVIFAENKGTYGNLVKVDHGNGVQTWYAHCSKIYVKAGQKVEAGDVIAAVGSTGNSTGSHLHFEIRINGSPVNPQKYLYK